MDKKNNPQIVLFRLGVTDNTVNVYDLFLAHTLLETLSSEIIYMHHDPQTPKILLYSF